jgi:hypothetical protein
MPTAIRAARAVARQDLYNSIVMSRVNGLDRLQEDAGPLLAEVTLA